jgi:hypothetical protein
MSIIKRRNGRYILVDDSGNEKRLTNREVTELRRVQSRTMVRVGFKGTKKRRIGGVKMESTMQNTNGKKAAEALRKMQSIFAKATINVKKEEDKILGAKYEK